jgi:hypothetical protein
VHQLDDIGVHYGLAQHLAAAKRRDVMPSNCQTDLAVNHDPHLLAVVSLPEHGLAVVEMPVAHLPATLLAWGDNSVSSGRSYNRAKDPGTSAGAFPMALSLSGEDPRGLRRGAKGSGGTPGTP